MKLYHQFFKKGHGGLDSFNSGGQRQNRTADTRIFSPLLYRLSSVNKGFPLVVSINFHCPKGQKKDKNIIPFLYFNLSSF